MVLNIVWNKYGTSIANSLENVLKARWQRLFKLKLGGRKEPHENK